MPLRPTGFGSKSTQPDPEKEGDFSKLPTDRDIARYLGVKPSLFRRKPVIRSTEGNGSLNGHSALLGETTVVAKPAVEAPKQPGEGSV